MKKIILFSFVLTLFLSCTSTIRQAYYTFPNSFDIYYKSRDTLKKSDNPFSFIDKVKNKNTVLTNRKIKIGNDKNFQNIEDIIENKGKTLSFMIIRNDSIIYEKYFEKNKGAKEIPVNVMSVTKSFVVTLLGIAIEEGFIGSMNDNIQKYIPELKNNKKLKNITLEQLVNMRAGLKYHEIGGMVWLNSRVVNIYYGKDHQKHVVGRAKSTASPDSYFHYQSLATSLVGIAIERATGKKLSSYMREKIWVKLGMEYDGYFTVDDTKQRQNRSFACLGVATRDLAKLGKAYLNDGKNFKDEQVIPLWMVKKVRTLNILINGYFYSHFYRHNRNWTPLKEWEKKNGKYKASIKNTELIKLSSDLLVAEPFAEEDQDFYAEGLLGNFIYAHPKSNTIIVRTGNCTTNGGVAWPELMRAIVKNENQIKNKYYKSIRLKKVY